MRRGRRCRVRVEAWGSPAWQQLVLPFDALMPFNQERWLFNSVTINDLIAHGALKSEGRGVGRFWPACRSGRACWPVLAARHGSGRLGSRADTKAIAALEGPR